MKHLTDEAAQQVLDVLKKYGYLEPVSAFNHAEWKHGYAGAIAIMQAAIDAEPPSGDHEALRQRLGEALTEVLTDENAAIEPDWFDAREINRVIDAILPALSADMLAANAQQMVVPLGWRLVPEMAAELLESGDLEAICFGSEHIMAEDARVSLYQARSAMLAAPKAREPSDEKLINIFRKVSRSWPPNGPHSEQIIEFARAVLAERSEP